MNDIAMTTRATASAPHVDATTDEAYAEGLGSYTDAGVIERLSTALAEHEKAAGRLDAVWTTHDSPLGPLLLAFHDGAVVRVAFENEGFDEVLDDLGARLGWRTLRAPRPADTLRRELDEYFDGHREAFTVPHSLVLSEAPFRRQVQDALTTIPYGTTASYLQVAQRAGRPKAVRAVGSACATNPLPIVLPCHRVLRSDGSVGQYLGGVEAKLRLLALEAGSVEAPGS